MNPFCFCRVRTSSSQCGSLSISGGEAVGCISKKNSPPSITVLANSDCVPEESRHFPVLPALPPPTIHSSANWHRILSITLQDIDLKVVLLGFQYISVSWGKNIFIVPYFILNNFPYLEKAFDLMPHLLCCSNYVRHPLL